jgi:hypothetical protein
MVSLRSNRLAQLRRRPVDDALAHNSGPTQRRGGHAARELEGQVPQEVWRVEGRAARSAGVVAEVDPTSGNSIAVCSPSSWCSGCTVAGVARVYPYGTHSQGHAAGSRLDAYTSPVRQGIAASNSFWPNSTPTATVIMVEPVYRTCEGPRNCGCVVRAFFQRRSSEQASILPLSFVGQWF